MIAWACGGNKMRVDVAGAVGKVELSRPRHTPDRSGGTQRTVPLGGLQGGTGSPQQDTDAQGNIMFVMFSDGRESKGARPMPFFSAMGRER